MITKWFLGVNAKSKGYFKEFDTYDWNNKGVARPKFTKQTALAPSYATKKDVEKELRKMEAYSKKVIKDNTKKVKEHNDNAENWTSMTLDEKVAELAKHKKYANHPTGGYQYSVNLQYGGIPTTFSKEQIETIELYDWKKEVAKYELIIKRANDELRYMAEKLIIRESEIEYKFKERERRNIKWENRSEEDTANYYCNACGGAIPSVPQLVIGSAWGRDGVRICAICMGRMADEAKIQAEKVSDEILEQYQTDRFLIAMD